MTQATATSNNGSSAASIPELSGGRPLIGHLPEFLKDPVGMLDRCWRDHGDLVRFRLGTRKFVLFTGPEAHDCYFRAPEEQLDARAGYQFTVPIFGRGVAYDVEPEIMAEQLGFLYPALRDASMRRYARIMYEETCAFADALGEEGTIDLPVHMNELTVKIASRCLLGQEVRDQVDSGFAEAYHDLEGGINLLGFFAPRLPIPAHVRRDRARRKITKILSEVMSERRRSGTATDDFMQTLMEARYEDGRALNDEEATGILLTALFAGQHTSAVLATWIGLEMFRDHDCVTRVRGEMQEVYSEDGALSLAGLNKQSALGRVVRECERLHPPLIILIRKVVEPLQYAGHTVTAGTMAAVCSASSHRLPHLFSDPHRFDPERFADPRNEGDQHKYALIGFGGGKHRCMGEKFALLQLKAIWTVLLDRFDFELATEFPAPNYGSWVTGPKPPCMVRYRRRSQARVIS
ncbi:MAG: cytochrome P450 [Acidimicrobiaceae bacterium]|nr:cytochrome P450 [Acidimicrobiaceae bacterium]MCY4175540.1 cytochrome P450 [Acidimicrobiaceae bacterium]MCY4293891.1 cytochrome P450 [Acidimicrobiaceae bacterium]